LKQDYFNRENYQEHYIIRNYHPQDLPAYCRIFQEKEENEALGHYPTLEFLKEKLKRPRFNPQEDIFLAFYNTRPAGFAELTPEPGIDRVILEGMVYPEHRKQGLGTLLLESCIQRARDKGINTLHVNITGDNPQGEKFLKHKGFKPVKKFVEMKTRLKKIPFLPSHKPSRKPSHKPSRKQGGLPSPEFQLRQLKEGEEKLLADLQNKCFRDTWGYQPNTPEDIRYRINLGGYTTQYILVAFLGQEPSGYCWTVFSPGRKTGRILMLGVLPAHRGKGLGKHIMEGAFKLFQKNNTRLVELTVDTDNLPALKLYRSFGFRKWKDTWWYELKLWTGD